MGRGLLFDASSLIYALKLRRPDILISNYIQWLTIYEVINGLWKEARLIKSITTEDVITMIRVLRDVTKYMNVLSPQGCEEEILKTALKLGITAYDASYAVLAKNNDLTLVTEDKELREKAGDVVEVKTLAEVIT